MNDFRSNLKYLGYAGANLERLNLSSFKNLVSTISHIQVSPNYSNLNIPLGELPSLTLGQVRSLARNFCEKYFNLNDILTIDIDKIKSNAGYISSAVTPSEAYERINSFLTRINPMDIEVRLVEGHSMIGLVSKPLAMISTSLDNPLRKVYFSHMEIGKQLNLISVSTMIHEIAHLQQEQNIGYTEDYLNKEIISIFLEKVSSFEMDLTGKLLTISERIRFFDLAIHYINLYKMYKKSLNLPIEKIIDTLTYIKSTLYAEKLFDMYFNEKDEKNKDKYFYEIQDVFDGKKTVEDIIGSRSITLEKAQDVFMLKKHL